MTLVEALLTNKPFKRAKDKDWFKPDFIYLGGLTKEDILANDWEVEE